MITCPICKLPRTGDMGDLSTCVACDHVWQTDLKATVKYDRDYVEKYNKYRCVDMSWLRLGCILSHSENGRRGRLLDVGYGNAAFLKEAKKAGFDAWGVDIHGLGLWPQEAGLGTKDRWDVVTFFDSLEHFEDLEKATCLARAGTIVVSTPERPRHPWDVFSWKHYKPGEHLHYFSRRSLSKLFSGYSAASFSNAEDSIRGGDGGANIMTAVFSGSVG